MQTVSIPRPPGPPARRAGLIPTVRAGLGFLVDPLGFVGGRFQRFGDIYYVAAEGQPGLFVLRHPDHLEQVLVTEARKFRKTHSALRHLSGVLGEGLLTSDGETWRRHRRLVQPAFSRQRLDEYAIAMVEEAEREASKWRDGERFDLSVAMMEMTLRIVSRTLFGHDSTGDSETVRGAMHQAQSAVAGLPLPDWLNPMQSRMKRASKSLDRIIYRLIARRRDGARAEPPDLLQMLIDAVDTEGDGRGLTEVEIRDQLVTLFLAGHETTANALTWTFYLLAQHPEVEARLHAEVDGLGNHLAYGDLTYTEQVFLEAMRLYPPVFMLARQAAEPTVIGGYPVPAGSEIVMWIYHTQRDPRFFEEPWAFKPERFAKDRIGSIPKHAYLPFGAGPRTCIGKHFATMEGTLALAAIAKRASFAVQSDSVEPRPRITLVPAGGMPVRVRVRQRSGNGK